MIRSVLVSFVVVVLLGCWTRPAAAPIPPLSEPGGEEPGAPVFTPGQRKKPAAAVDTPAPVTDRKDPKASPPASPAAPPPALPADDEDPPRKASPPPAAPGSTQEPITASGFMLKVALPVASGVLTTSSSQISFNALPAVFLGGISSIGIGGGLGVQFSNISVTGSYTSDSMTTIILCPQLSYISPGTAGGKVRFTLNAGPILGIVEGLQSYSETELVAGYIIGLGGMFFPHRSFGVGVEAGLAGQFWTESDLSINYMYGALTAVAIFGG